MTIPLVGLPLWQDDDGDRQTNATPRRARPVNPANVVVNLTDSRPDGPSHLWGLIDPDAGPVELDWEVVAALRSRAATELTQSGGDEVAGRAITTDLVAGHSASQMAAGQPGWNPLVQLHYVDAVLAALFGVGRFDPLLRNPTVENIEIYGCDNVTLVLTDGRIVAGPAVAESDEELIEQLQFMASRTRGSGARPFSEAYPRLHLNLERRDGMPGARLAATAWITPRPTVVIRIHRLVDVTLADLVERDMLDQELAGFLGAAVRAGRSIVVSGPQGAGKTTLVRALCAEMDPFERIGTLETERELFLHEMPEAHHRVVPWESRPGSGERGPDGRLSGEITLGQVVEDSLRFGLSRLIVGEVRGREVMAMFQAMQTGAGSISTTHANNARGAIERLVTCAMDAGAHVTSEYAYRLIAQHIDLIVQANLKITGGGRNPRRERSVSEVLLVEPGEGGRPATTSLWRRDPASGKAVRATIPTHLLDDLAPHGYREAHS